MELIERENFILSLHNGFKKATSGEGNCFFIVGEAGIGKTSLIKSFLQLVENESIVYIGACDSLFTPRPLAPLYDIAWQINEDWDDKIQSIVSRTILFAKFVQELTNKDKPIVLVFEDIHWADEATLDFIVFFARRISRTKCLFILTFRDNEVNQQHPLRKVMGDLNAETFTRIHLPLLSKQTVYKLAAEKGYNPAKVYHISGGNPFYVNEILASYSEGVPDTIKDSIISVYNRQEEKSKNVLQLLSVIPEGLEFSQFSAIEPFWQEAISDCFEKKILILEQGKIIFKHELYRITIEAELSLFKKIALNKKILDLFLATFEKENQIERIVHYAKNANENNLVEKYAPLAASQAALVGAHIEAAKLYFSAIESTQEKDTDNLAKLFEAYTYECYLTNQIKEAILYQIKALKIWEQKNDIEQIGNSMRFLSRLWWFDGKYMEAEKWGIQAIAVLEPQPSSRAKAMAFSNMSQFKMLNDSTAECIEFSTKAIEIAKEINDNEVLCHALNNVGNVLWKVEFSKKIGKEYLFESLDIALKNSFHEHVARAYTNIICSSITNKEYELAKQFLQEGLSYCEERDLNSWTKYILSWQARILLEIGDWNQAATIAGSLLTNIHQTAVVKIGALVTLATIKIRRGESDAVPLLQEAKSLAFLTKEHQRIIPVMIAFFEHEWLTSEQHISEEELNVGIELIQNSDNFFLNHTFTFWLQKARKIEIVLAKPEFSKIRKESMAADFWEQIGSPFERAFALFDGDENEKRQALSIFQQLGADSVCEKIKLEMRSSGIRKIPRG